MTDRRLARLALVPLALTAAARADINGFGDFSAYSINVWDSAAPPTPFPASNAIRLTNQASGESRSIFHKTKQVVTQFTASFTYQASGTPTDPFGACFVIQNSRGGPQTVAAANTSGVPTQFGYSDEGESFRNSIAISLEHGSLSASSSSTSQYRDGSVGAGSSSTSPIDLFSGHPINVSLTYNGVILTEHLLDTVTQATFDTAYALTNLPAILGDTSGYVGFVASTNRNVATTQTFSNLLFTSVPAPSTAALLGLGGLGALRRRR